MLCFFNVGNPRQVQAKVLAGLKCTNLVWLFILCGKHTHLIAPSNFQLWLQIFDGSRSIEELNPIRSVEL